MDPMLHTLPYVVLLVNTALASAVRSVVLPFCPPLLSSFVKEFIATLELCADCAELSVVYEVHGVVGYGVTLFLLCFWWSRVWDDAEACPCGPIEESFLCGIPITSPSIVVKLVGQMVAAYFTWQ